MPHGVPRRNLPAAVLDRIVQAALPNCRVLASEPLTDGLRNASFKLRLHPSPEPVVLRIYEHDALLCQKELDIMRLVRAAVPLPEVLHAEPHGWEDLPPFTLARWLEGVSFLDLKRSGDAEAIADGAGRLVMRGVHRKKQLALAREAFELRSIGQPGAAVPTFLDPCSFLVPFFSDDCGQL